MVSTRPPTSKSSTPFNNPLVTVSKAPITIGIIVTFMFHSFFNFFESFFTAVGGLSLEFEWEKVYSGFMDSFKYSIRSKIKFCSWDVLESSDFHLLQFFFFQAFRVYSKWTNYNWYYRHTHIPQFLGGEEGCFFLVSWYGSSTCFSFRFLLFSLCDSAKWQNPLDDKFIFLNQF